MDTGHKTWTTREFIPVTSACTSSMSFCFSSASKLLYHLARRVFPARFWIRMNLMGMAGQGGEAPRAPGVKDEVVVGVVQGLDDGDEVGVAAVQPPEFSFQ